MADSKLWGGRFARPTAELMEQFNASIGFDIRLFEADIEGSLAQAAALRRAGVLSAGEWAEIVLGLHQVRQEIADGTYQPAIETEDIHMAVEARLIELIGPVGGKIHTGRSRNDQVALDIRIFVRRELRELDMIIDRLQRAVVDRAEQEIDTIIPGYTHLQQAQPIRLGHYFMALFWMLQRDRVRLRNARDHADRMPLGAGALAGSAYPIDRDFLCKRLGFSASTENSLDAVTDRDFLAEAVFAIAQFITHLSRFAEDWVIWSSREFGFIELDDAYATGSSMMPQKKNPDSLELIRGKTGRVFGDLLTLLTIQKGLPLTYGKDLQEDKEPLFDALDTARYCALVFTGVVETMKVKRTRMREAIDANLYATDLADALVRRGIPFREAHHIVGGLVGTAVARDIGITALPWEEIERASPLIKKEDIDWLSPESSAEARKLYGGTARNSVLEQLEAARRWLKEQEAQ